MDARKDEMKNDILTSLRFVGLSLAVCAIAYPALLFAFGRLVVPERSAGSLLRDSAGTIVGSRLIAQDFRRPEYLWPRPSAASYNAAAASGSNLAASNPELRRRAVLEVERHEATPTRVAPAELVLASGSGLDPHVTLAGARFQVARIAAVRGVTTARVEDVLRRVASGGNPWLPPLVNVLEANLALDRDLGTRARTDRTRIRP